MPKYKNFLVIESQDQYTNMLSFKRKMFMGQATEDDLEEECVSNKSQIPEFVNIDVEIQLRVNARARKNSVPSEASQDTS